MFSFKTGKSIAAINHDYSGCKYLTNAVPKLGAGPSRQGMCTNSSKPRLSATVSAEFTKLHEETKSSVHQ